MKEKLMKLEKKLLKFRDKLYEGRETKDMYLSITLMRTKDGEDYFDVVMEGLDEDTRSFTVIGGSVSMNNIEE